MKRETKQQPKVTRTRRELADLALIRRIEEGQQRARRVRAQQPRRTDIRFFTATGEVVEVQIAGPVALYPTKEKS